MAFAKFDGSETRQTTLSIGAETVIAEFPIGGRPTSFVFMIKNHGGTQLNTLRLEGLGKDNNGGTWFPIVDGTDWASYAAGSTQTVTGLGVFTPSVSGLKEYNSSATSVHNLAATEYAVIEINVKAYEQVRFVAMSTGGTSVTTAISYDSVSRG